jgi:spermidine/putrescine transport system substrate-binding protein
MQWWDDWVIPVGAPNPTAAYKWINYTYEPKHQAQIGAWTSAVTPVKGVKQIFQKTDPPAAKNPLIFPSAQYTRNCSTPISPPGSAQEQKQVEQAWTALTTG